MTIQKLQIRPYARLLTMLGDQLIKNELIALVELIKNSYDADSSNVKIRFENFDDNYSVLETSKITIEDDGCGMSEDILTNHWLNPATPNKKLAKQRNRKTFKGRIIQGEKGIGRFALLKLGKHITITTKTESDVLEHVLIYDFSKFNEDFIDSSDNPLLLEELTVEFENRLPKCFAEGKQNLKHGTIIEICNLKDVWSYQKIEQIYDEIGKLTSIFENSLDFDVFMYRDNYKLPFGDNYKQSLLELISNNAVFRIEQGHFDSQSRNFSFLINDKKSQIKLDAFPMNGLALYSTWCRGNTVKPIECGNFTFSFYVFDFSPDTVSKYKLDKTDKKLIKQHRIYLYRDGIRVYPYGDSNDDWLGIDASRSTYRVGEFFSNDQIIGLIDITQVGNPRLRDKTNREGLLDDGEATRDFVMLLKLFLSYIRQYPYQDYRHTTIQTEKAKNNVSCSEKIEELLVSINTGNKQNKLYDLANNLKLSYINEKKSWEQRFKLTEDLAGVGISVETASHDLMATINRVNTNHSSIITDLRSNNTIDKSHLIDELSNIQEALLFIKRQMSDMQLLFRSSKQRRKDIIVLSSIEKIKKLFDRILIKEGIEAKIDSCGPEIKAFSTDAVLLQVFINLFDNAIYWLLRSNNIEKKIIIHLDGYHQRIFFADNGPGILPESEYFIFEPFYSGKGEEGRGLGLYIARQLLNRSNYSINVVTKCKNKLLSGANFIIDFKGTDNV